MIYLVFVSPVAPVGLRELVHRWRINFGSQVFLLRIHKLWEASKELFIFLYAEKWGL